MFRTFKPSSLRTKIVVAGVVLMCVIAALAMLLYVSASQYEYHLERNTVAHRVLSGFQSISDHAYRKLNAMGQIGSQGAVDDVNARVENERQLWSALSTTRQFLADEFEIDADPSHHTKVERLDEIEDIVEKIIAGGAAIRDAVRNSDGPRVQSELTNLRSQAIAGKFNRLIDEAIVEERAVVESTRAAATRLSAFINSALPAAILLTLAVGLIAMVTISRSLTRSFSDLRIAADAYTSGNLEHRSEALRDPEFAQLGDAFNRMAEELGARRQEAEHSQVFLEGQVQQRTQELAKTLEKLETVDATRRRFLAEISHELRTPLTLIQGEAEMVLRGQDKEVSSYKEALVRVREQTVHTAHLVKDLLLVARAEEGNLRIEKSNLDVAELLNEVCIDFRSAASKRNLEIICAPTCGNHCVDADRNRLRQVFAILLDNAIRYSDERENVLIETFIDEGVLGVTIANRGVGLSEAEASQVFDRFYRSDRAAHRSDGSGLGLPVAKAIVEAHAGQIRLQTRDDRVVAEVRLPMLESTNGSR